jgi:hypothetical protein
MAKDSVRYTAFLSYARVDDGHGDIEKLHAALQLELEQQWKQGSKIFIDRGISAGQKWREVVGKGLADSSFCITAFSPSFFGSSECREEVSLYLEMSRQRGVEPFLVPVVVVPISGVEQDDLLSELTTRQFEDYTRIRFKKPDSEEFREFIFRLVGSITAELRGPIRPASPKAADLSKTLRALEAENKKLREEAHDLQLRQNRQGEETSELRKAYRDLQTQMDLQATEHLHAIEEERNNAADAVAKAKLAGLEQGARTEQQALSQLQGEIKDLRKANLELQSQLASFDSDRQKALIREQNKLHQLISQGILVDEKDVARLLGERMEKLGPFSIPVAVGTGMAIARSTEALHRVGIAYGTINPQNIAILVDGDARLTAKGVWEARSPGYADLNLPADSRPYLPPEVRSAAMISLRADVYAIGTVIYEMLTGRLPPPPQIGNQVPGRHAKSSIPMLRTVLPAIPQFLDELIMKAIAIEPEVRYPSAAEMLIDLRLQLDALRFGRILTWPK